MLTRLKVNGFKNLADVDVQFGPFTCIAGPNGVGKSNLFDAIAFLGALADKTLAEAAATIRGSEGRLGDVRALFRNAGGQRAREMSFEVEMIVPQEGVDDYGSIARASITFLRYELRLRMRQDPGELGPLEVVHESMHHINLGDARRTLGFSHAQEWRDSVVRGRRTTPYIQTREEGGKGFVFVHADSAGGKGGGGARRYLLAGLPKTVLSNAKDAAEHRTLVLARKEMMGWTEFQLEPSALRSPDPFNAPRGIAPNGAHMPATLFALGKEAARTNERTAEDVYQSVANRLAELFEDVNSLRVDEDEKREQYAIALKDMQGSEHVASSLSDGTLRFLALSILEEGAGGPSLLCLEEPENGIHPDRIPAMIELLRDIAVDAKLAVDGSNPMRQVIINTHSPGVVGCVPDDCLVVAESVAMLRAGKRERLLRLRGLPNTWRHPEPKDGAPLLSVLGYVLPLGMRKRRQIVSGEQRVVDRPDIQRQLGLFGADG